MALLMLGLSVLAIALACGSNSSNTIVTGCPTPSGSFGNASLAGTWTYHLVGNLLSTDPNTGNLVATPYREAGVFTTDSNGNITSGTDDLAVSGQAFSAAAAFTGTYSIHNDGTGTVTINFPNQGGTLSLGIAMVSSSQFYVIEADNFANAAGGGDKQASPAMPVGTFVFGAHSNGTAQGANSRVGVMTVSNTGAVNVSQDSLALGSSAVRAALTGNLTAPDGTGRGTLTLSDATTFEYYAIDSNTFGLLESDGLVGSGRAEKQTASTSLTAGGWAFGSTGDATNLDGVHSVGALTSDGNGNITAGAYDSVQDNLANPVANLGFTGSNTSVDGIGRTVLTLNPTGSAPILEVYYLVSPSRAFFLVNDPTKVEDGTADQQSTNSFANSSLSGQYALVMDGFDSNTNDLVDRVATMQGDGKGNLNLNELVNRTGSANTPGCMTGNFTASANGRVTAAVNTLSSNLVIYMVSSNKGYILQGDAGVEISGTIVHQ